MFQNTLNSLSLVALIVAATVTLVLLGRARRAVAQNRSRRVECYYRDLKKIDEQERSGKLDETAAEKARAILLKSTISGTSQSQQDPWNRFGEYKSVITSLLITATFLMSTIATGGNSNNGPLGTRSADNSGSSASLSLASMAMAGDNAQQNPAQQKPEDELANLKKYVKTIGSGPTQFNFATMFTKTAGDTNQSAPMSKPPSLPDVDTMITRLAARLKKSPNDVEGWRMLGWSYFNTGKYEKSIAAYQKALELNPASAQLQAALNEAKSKMLGAAPEQAKTETETETKIKTAPGSMAKADTNRSSETFTQDSLDTGKPDTDTKIAKGPTAQDIENSKSMMPADRQAMIMGMVNRLAARLEKSPRDAAGWQRLIHSRMVLGDKDAARKALTRALEIFASEPKIKATITAAAEKSGVTITTTN